MKNCLYELFGLLFHMLIAHVIQALLYSQLISKISFPSLFKDPKTEDHLELDVFFAQRS